MRGGYRGAGTRWRNELGVRRGLLYIRLSLCAGDGEGSDYLCQGIGVLSEGGLCYSLYNKLEMYRGLAIGHHSLAGSFHEPCSMSVLSHML